MLHISYTEGKGNHMESRNEMHASFELLMRLVHTVRFMRAYGRSRDQIALDLVRSHGLTRNDLNKLFSLIGE